jgi:hypothetical protein
MNDVSSSSIYIPSSGKNVTSSDEKWAMGNIDM